MKPQDSPIREICVVVQGIDQYGEGITEHLLISSEQLKATTNFKYTYAGDSTLRYKPKEKKE